MLHLQVIAESQRELLLAERYLYALRQAYPEVLASIRTKQVAQELLLFKEEYIGELEASGDHMVAVCHHVTWSRREA